MAKPKQTADNINFIIRKMIKNYLGLEQKQKINEHTRPNRERHRREALRVLHLANINKPAWFVCHLSKIYIVGSSTCLSYTHTDPNNYNLIVMDITMPNLNGL